VLFGLSLCLLGGAAVQQFLKPVPLPYTVLLLVFGALLGVWTMFDPAFTLQPGTPAGGYQWEDEVLACNVTSFVPNDLFNHGSHLGNSVRRLANIDSHLLLHLLLPPLLFESAFSVDWHVFTKIWGYALLLAGPGLVIGTILTGFTYIGLYPEWPWEAAMLLAGILAATDPGASRLDFPH
jgi:NhaP-type Na+/H+ or K+/H+ antiporter